MIQSQNYGISFIVAERRMIELKKLLFCAYDLNIGGIETALINLLNNMDYSKYEITLVLENKNGVLLDRVNKKVIIKEYKVSQSKNIVLRKLKNFIKRLSWIVKNYHKYDFSCCFATYSMPCNVLGYYGSSNNCFFIHSNYTIIYPDERDLRSFFNVRRINKFRKVVFVADEARNDLIRYYPKLEETSLTISSLINNNNIIELSKEKIDIKKGKNTLFVFVGRLEEASKKITRLINVVKQLENVDFWIVGGGDDYDLYHEMIKGSNNIKMLGPKKNPYPYMLQADYIVLSSDYEGFPLIYYEAIVLNKKIITTIDVSDDYLKVDEHAHIVSKNENIMLEEIRSILKSDNLKQKKVDFNEINRKKIKKLEDIIEEVI